MIAGCCRWRWMLALVLAIAAAQAFAETTRTDRAGTLTLDHAEAVRADASSSAPPAQGWQEVTLMDFWDQRWPTYDGVVWYRVRWLQDSDASPIGLLISYACMAQAIYVNGSLVHTDERLEEPLSRSWIRPHYFLIDRPLLHAGENTLWIRVSGIAAYQPGLGEVTVGAPAAVQAIYRHELFWRYDLHVFSQAIDAVFCSLFLILWLLRRNDSAYGWYALTSLISLLYNVNFIADSTWPFASTDGWQAFILAAFVSNASVYCVFLLRFCERRWPRTERVLLTLAILQTVWSLGWPHSAGMARNVGFLLGSVVNLGATLWFIGYAIRGARHDHRVLAACLALPCAAGIHDLLALFGITHSDNYLLALTAPLSLIGMGFALAFRFAAAMRRVEGFNTELRHEVDVATARLRETLNREHELSLSHTRTHERLNLVRDIHDGFGGSLLGTIAALGKAAPSPEREHAIASLKELRDDLRLVIDTSAHEYETDLAGVLAPLRHQWSNRLDVAGMESHWTFDGLDALHPASTVALDLLRFLQEVLTNVIKHSHASRVDIHVERHGERLLVHVRDDGRGFVNDGARVHGTGLASLRSRAARLGGQFSVLSAPGEGTRLDLAIPLPVGASAAGR